MRAISGFAVACLLAGPLRADDWPMWGGRPDRNMVSPEKRLPATWDPAKHVKWAADLGSQTFGNPVVSGGRIYIGTNNGRPRDPAVQGDKGVLMCFSEKDGAFLWQAVHDKLPAGDAEDWTKVGICSTPCVVDDRVYYVSNRAELVCADASGRAARFVWVVDLKKDLGVTPYQASSSSPLVVGDLVFVHTGQGVDARTHEVKNPAAPSFIAVDRATGKVVWKDASPGRNILAGQWASPAYGVVDGRPQVAFPGGDGWLYAFDPPTGRPLWKFNAKPDESQNHLVATPVYAGHRVVISIGQDPEAGPKPGCLWAIDARTGKELWRRAGEEFGCSISTVAVHEGLVYAVELDGRLRCLDLETGGDVWSHDLQSTSWGSPLVADGKVYVRNGDEEVHVLRAGREKKLLAKNTLPGLAHGSVVAAGGTLYIAGEERLYAVVSGD